MSQAAQALEMVEALRQKAAAAVAHVHKRAATVPELTNDMPQLHTDPDDAELAFLNTGTEAMVTQIAGLTATSLSLMRTQAKKELQASALAETCIELDKMENHLNVHYASAFEERDRTIAELRMQLADMEAQHAAFVVQTTLTEPPRFALEDALRTCHTAYTVAKANRKDKAAAAAYAAAVTVVAAEVAVITPGVVVMERD